MCMKCGATGSERLVLLARKCKGPDANPGTLRNIEYFKKGKKLPGFAEWPYRKAMHPFKETIKTMSREEADALTRVVRQVQSLATLENPLKRIPEAVLSSHSTALQESDSEELV